MNQLVIQGGSPLVGGGGWGGGVKNAVLPILAACLLSKEPVTVRNIPHLRDVTIMVELLGQMGVGITIGANMQVIVDSGDIQRFTAPYELVKAMRASVLVLGPLLSRFHQAQVALPGGCAIGARPIDLHIEGLRAMGADIELNQGYITAKTNGPLKGAHLNLSTVTVTGTENLMMAAVLAEGVTRIENAACEPEVEDLANFLNKMGAKICGAGTKCIEIEGVSALHGGDYSVLPDRIEAGTYLVAAAVTGGYVRLENVCVKSLGAILAKLQEAGAVIESGDHWVSLDMRHSVLKPVNIKTAPYPGFPTDMQAQMMVLNAVAQGVSTITETIFENRFMHVPELQRMGAEITVNGNTAVCQGGGALYGVPVRATDLRASASLVLAALAAQGETCIDEVTHIDRGYERIEEKLLNVGARVSRMVGSD
ncbi:UDP-N-acetylglucosamine 1-carboxyvinyltransferase [Piscirickettsia salmonis]|uniref:UDP-N-acetylglucosamine 1-carboxyvinyltransferase n=1 Tax=Piscirickettsia salmonis TaxID=1238 RepID=UPI000745CDD9|nr:UDP-N-acetylglucosamine 1-carboxyvinyltransferase [Piscirickettsia salmonis]AMA43834.1 UDP-N-acetylglucosamine 1-carboxyvinyltransferase [Piscirickettsia salmonis]